MSEINMFSILKKLLSKEEIQQLAEMLVIEGKSGYELFDEYSIEKTDMGYIVKKYKTFVEHSFFNLRNAVVWATLDKRNKILDANSVVTLDSQLQSTLASLELHQKLCKKTKNIDSKSLYFIKLNEDKVKKYHIMSKLDNYVIETKRWQNKKFAEAIK
jgi:hypothetical protein